MMPARCGDLFGAGIASQDCYIITRRVRRVLVREAHCSKALIECLKCNAFEIAWALVDISTAEAFPPVARNWRSSIRKVSATEIPPCLLSLPLGLLARLTLRESQRALWEHSHSSQTQHFLEESLNLPINPGHLNVLEGIFSKGAPMFALTSFSGERQSII